MCQTSLERKFGMKSFTQRWREASDEAEDQPMEDTPTDLKKLEGVEFYQDSMRRIAEVFGIVTPLQLIMAAENNEENYVDILLRSIRNQLADKDAALAEQTERADRLQAIDIERSGTMGRIAIALFGDRDNNVTDEQCERKLEELKKESEGRLSRLVFLTAELDAAKEWRNEAEKSLVQAGRGIADLIAELDAVRKERDEAIKQRTEWVCDLADQRDAAQAKCAELEKLIQDAPHTVDCDGIFEHGPTPVVCTCWKSRLTPAPPEEKRQEIWTKAIGYDDPNSSFYRKAWREREPHGPPLWETYPPEEKRP